jgi:hypothetical protein
MIRPTPLRLAAAVACWAVVCAVGLVLELRPAPLGLAGVVLGSSVLVWTLLDLSHLVRTPRWLAHAEEPRPVTEGDPRLTRLYSTMRKAPGSPAAAAELAADLTRIAQSRLDARVGRRTGEPPDPGTAWPDPELQRLLADPTLLPTDPAALSPLLDRIESL